MEPFDMYTLAEKLWPINRSITGRGVRETLKIIRNSGLSSLSISEIPTGTKVLDWTIPQEWEVKRAFIKKPDGSIFCDYSQNNLHLVGYSIPIHQKMTLTELNNFLYSLPDQPDAIPYVTSYYEPKWGFCLTQNERDLLKEGEYEVFIESRHFDGFLTFGELIIKGETTSEILLSTYICHPSMANNEISGPVVTTAVSLWLDSLPSRRFTYRILFIPETIGSIAYLSQHLEYLQSHVVAGFNITCIGDERTYSYLPSRNGRTLSDRIALHVLKWTDPNYIAYTWDHRGSDERQYCAPGIDLPIASIMRSKYGEYPEYHTSLDQLGTVVTAQGLQGGFEIIKKAIQAIEVDFTTKMKVLGEPQLGNRGLYPNTSIKGGHKDDLKILMNLITWSDGKHTLLEIAEKINVPIWDLTPYVQALKDSNLLETFIEN